MIFKKGDKITIPTADSFSGNKGDERRACRKAKELGQDHLWVVNDPDSGSHVYVSSTQDGPPESVFHTRHLTLYTGPTVELKVGDKVKIPKTKRKTTIYNHSELLNELREKGNPDHLVVESFSENRDFVYLELPEGRSLRASAFYLDEVELLETKTEEMQNVEVSKLKIGDKVAFPKTKVSGYGEENYQRFLKEVGNKCVKTPTYMLVTSASNGRSVGLEFPKEFLKDPKYTLNLNSFTEGDLEPFTEETRKLIGYKAPFELNSLIREGTLFIQGAGEHYVVKGRDGQGSQWYLTAKIVETWEAVYEEAELKEGDWVIAKDRNRGIFEYAFAVGKADGTYIWHTNKINNRGKESFRKATPAEIKAAQDAEELVIVGYQPEFTTDTVNWGCKTFTRDQIEGYLHLLEKTTSEIKVEGKELTRSFLRKILNKIDEKK